MLYRVRGSTFRTLSVRNLQPLRIRIPSSGGNLLYLPHLRCSLDSRSIHFLVASPSTGLTSDCAGPDARDPGCSAIAGAAAQSCSRSHPPPLLHASLSLIWLITTAICPMAKRPRDLETGYQRFRLQRHSQWGQHRQVEELNRLLPL